MGEVQNRQGADLFQDMGVSVEEAQRQYAEVESRYRGTDLWMKAPNGKPTKLTERQWVQVRTPAFKEWFWDWEAAENFRWLMTAENVASITGEEFSKGETSLVDNVAAFYENLGNRVSRKGVGEVSLTRHDIQASIAHGIGRKKAAAFAAVPKVIQSGREFNRTENYKDRGYTSVTIAAPITIADEEYICEVVINQQGNSNHFYLHEVEIKEKLQFGNQVRNYMDENHPNRNTKTGVSRLIIAKLLSEGKFNSSQVVDKNGEPLVVYHATDSDFTVFQSGNSAGTIYFGFTAKAAKKAARGKRNIIPSFLSVKNPVNTISSSIEWYDAESGQKVSAWKNAGNDGVFVNDEAGTSIAVFSPGQIKSATYNIGAFNAENPNILFQTSATRMDVPFGGGGEASVYALAKESQAEFTGFVRDIASSFGLDEEAIKLRSELKKQERARAKVEEDYAGDWGRILDINAGTLIFDTYDETMKAYEKILSDHADLIVRTKDKDTDFGYRDFILNVRMSNGFVGEMMLLDKNVYTAKKAGGHKIYGVARELDKYHENKEKYSELFGTEIHESIERLYVDLKAWSVEVYSRGGLEYDKPGLSAKASAVSRESSALSNLLRPNIPRSLSVGSLSMTDLPSAEGANTIASETPLSSVLMGISQISKYLTAIESSSTDSVSLSQISDNNDPDTLYQLSDEAKEEILNYRENDVQHALVQKFRDSLSAETIAAFDKLFSEGIGMETIQNSQEISSPLFQIEDFSPEYTEHSGRPQEAIDHLLDVKQGSVPEAMYKEGIGDIDFVYGKIGKEGYGLAHIQEKHPAILPHLVELIETGVISSPAKDRKNILLFEGRAAIRLDWNGEKKIWLVTAYYYRNHLSGSTGTDATLGMTSGSGQVQTDRLGTSIESADAGVNDKADILYQEETQEIKQYSEKIRHWLNPENMEKVQGRNREEIFSMFPNDLESIGRISPDYVSYFGQVTDSQVYSGQAYFIDHAVNHHPENTIDEYIKIPDVIFNPDYVKMDERRGGKTLVFIKNDGRYNAAVVTLEKSDDGRILLHKTFFAQKKEPYPRLKRIGPDMSSVGGMSTISQDEDSSSGGNLSARDDTYRIAKKDSGVNDDNTLYQLSDEAREEILNYRENDVQHALEGNYYVPTSVVDEYAVQGKEWAIKEMNLRSMINASPELIKKARDYQFPETFIETMKNDSTKKLVTIYFIATSYQYRAKWIRTTDPLVPNQVR